MNIRLYLIWVGISLGMCLLGFFVGGFLSRQRRDEGGAALRIHFTAAELMALRSILLEVLLCNSDVHAEVHVDLLTDANTTPAMLLALLMDPPTERRNA